MRRSSGIGPAALVGALLLVALLLRLPGIDRFPPAIHQDEASNGVDGWSLMTTGSDRAGREWPVFLQGFGAGDNRTSLYAILTIPGIAIFGPGTMATRLPAGLIGGVTVLAVFVFMRRIRGNTAAFASACLLAANPWHLYLSRYGHEASLTPAFLVIALWLISPGRDETASRIRWLMAGLVLGAGLYSYPSFRLFLPFLLPLAVVIGAGPRLEKRGLLLIIALVLAAVPLIASGATHPDRFFARAGVASVLGNVQPTGEALSLIARQYASHYLPTFLFVRGDGNLVHSPPGGQLLWVELLPLLLGVVLAFRRRDRWDRVFLLWLVLYPIASAATLGDHPDFIPHSLRAAIGLPLFQLLGGQGVADLLERLAGFSRRSAHATAVVLASALLVNLAVFGTGFVGSYARASAPLYNAAYPAAIRYLAENRDRFEGAAISCGDNSQAYIYSLLYGLQTPSEFQAAEKIIDSTETYHLVRRAGRLFYLHEPADQRRHLPHLHGTIWAVVIPGQLQSGRVMKEFPYADGTPGLEVRELEFPQKNR